jgi:hypothetical protein
MKTGSVSENVLEEDDTRTRRISVSEKDRTAKR